MKIAIVKLTVSHSQLLKILMLIARRFIQKDFPHSEPFSLLVAVRYEQRSSLGEVFSLCGEAGYDKSD